MKKLSYVLATLATVAIGGTTAASAGGFGIYVGGPDYNYYGGPRFSFYEHDRGLHRGWYHRNYPYGDREVVIRRHYWNDY